MPKKIYGLAVVLAVSAFFTATQPITPEMAIVSSVSVLFFAFPSYRAVLKDLSVKHGLIVLGALGLYALALESSAINTGFPYGNFVYTDVLGTKVLRLTPWTVAFAYPPILLAAYWFVRTRGVRNFWLVVALTSVVAMIIDLVLDPAAVALGFWFWDTPGFYYDVPLINFAGWLLSGAVGAALLHYLWGHNPKPTPAIAYSGVAIIFFWSMVNLFLGQLIPVVIGVALCVLFINQMKQKKVQCSDE